MYLAQTHPIDIATWRADGEFATYPQGARPKMAVFAPGQEDCPDTILPNRRYLFKESAKPYPDQYWSEVVAYRIAGTLGFHVPPAFSAFDSRTGICGALIQWFYTDDVERFVYAGDLLQNVFPNFDRRLGTDHNLKDISSLMRALALHKTLHPDEDWHVWWGSALVFDSLIGNTDRHQDNWGFLYTQEVGGTHDIAKLCPLFDNGTSLGHERFTDKVSGWTDADLDRYIFKGKHHVRWEPKAPREAQVTLLARTLQIWPRVKPTLRDRILTLKPQTLVHCFADLCSLDMPTPMTETRRAFMLRLALRRLTLIQEIFA